MAYDVRALSSIAFGAASAAGAANMTKVFVYRTPDTAATVEGAGYFNNARSRLTKGSIIFAAMVVGGTPVLKAYVVTAVPAAPSNVTVALQTTTGG